MELLAGKSNCVNAGLCVGLYRNRFACGFEGSALLMLLDSIRDALYFINVLEWLIAGPAKP